MSAKERMSKLPVPDWWLQKAIPILKSINQADVARDASAHAQRTTPWTASAISHFINDDIGRTVALTNGISAALQIPPPFFIAPTEQAASEMHRIVKREQAHVDDDVDQRSVVDGVVDREMSISKVDAPKRRAVVSTDNGAQIGRGVRARRASKGRS